MATTDLVSALYQRILNRPADAAGLAAAAAAVDAGVSLQQISVSLALSAEAQFDINTLYLNELGRPADAVTLDADITYLANGGTLLNLQVALGQSAEAYMQLQQMWQAIVGEPFASTYFQTYLADGGTLAGVRSFLAGSAYGQGDVGSVYATVLNRAPTAAELASATAYLAGGATPRILPPLPSIGYAGSPVGNTLISSLANTGEVIADINAAYQAAFGHAADAVEIAGAQSELVSGATLRDVIGQIDRAGPVPTQLPPDLAAGLTGYIATVTPQMIGGSAGSFAYPLSGGDNLISPNPGLSVLYGFGAVPYYGQHGGAGALTVTGFNPATDVIELQSGQMLAPNTAVTFHGGIYDPVLPGADIGGASVTQVGNAAVIQLGSLGVNLAGVNASSLTAANFRFVS